MSNPGTRVPGANVPPGAPPQVQFWEVPYTYNMDFPVAGNASLLHQTTQNGSIQIQADADFKWVKATAFADLAGAAQTESSLVIPLVTVQIQDGGTNQNLFSTPIEVANYFGRGVLPFILPTPYIFKKTSTLTFQANNYSVATDYTNLRLSLIGSKIYWGSAQPQNVNAVPVYGP